jgi:hypothetical protein
MAGVELLAVNKWTRVFAARIVLSERTNALMVNSSARWISIFSPPNNIPPRGGKQMLFQLDNIEISWFKFPKLFFMANRKNHVRTISNIIPNFFCLSVE